jgi:type IV conjugative transfer system protein TraE
MKLSILAEQFQKVLKQRNMLFPTVILLGISQVLLILLLFWKDDRTIFMPPVLDKPFSIHGSSYSASYYEQMGVFLVNLLLTKTSETAEQQHQLLYKYVDPELLGVFKRDLTDEVDTLKKDAAGYVFYPIETKVNLGTKSVLIKGERHTYVGAQRIDVSKEAYRLMFVQRGHVLYLCNFKKESVNE